MKLTHLRDDGTASMVDVSGKAVSRRRAVARGFIRLTPGTLAAVTGDRIAKGNVLGVARIAGIQAAKQTSGLIPLCHPLSLNQIEVEFEVREDGIAITCAARTDAKTGVEMEALTGVSVAALTIYDMCKAIDKTMRIEGIELVEKTRETLTEPESEDTEKAP